LSLNVTIIFVALSTTWPQVTTIPVESTITPDPKDRAKFCPGDSPKVEGAPKKKLKKGSLLSIGFGRFRGCDVEILTTAGAAFFTIGA
jgi:hypothetical protein